MSGRSTPDRIDEARRAATRNRLIGEHVTEETANAWIAAWAAERAGAINIRIPIQGADIGLAAQGAWIQRLGRTG